jgi:hypothetical protein
MEGVWWSVPFGAISTITLTFLVRRHILRERLEHSLRDKILQVLATMNPCRWISVDYIQLRYDRLVEKNNPVVV